MKMLKLALLGGAALAVTSAGAYADDLSALKAEIEALNSRVAQLEATPSVPAGYQLVTVSEGERIMAPGRWENDSTLRGYNKATVISVLPTADAPASTEITWSGYARAALVYTKDGILDQTRFDNPATPLVDETRFRREDDWDVFARGQIDVTGKTDTAVGEVGAHIRVRGEFDGNFRLPSSGSGADVRVAWGWWSMTPELTLGGGYDGSIGDAGAGGFGVDGACNCYYTDNFEYFGPGDTTQMRLTWTSGPITAAAALEDGTGQAGSSAGTAADSLGGSANIKYAGDMFSAAGSGFWYNQDDTASEAYQIGAGVSFGLGDLASITAAGAWGHDHSDTDYWKASVLASANLSDAVHAEIGYAHIDYDNTPSIDTVLGGIYYDPVSQLTIGVEAEWASNVFAPLPGDNGGDWFTADLVTVFRF